MTVYVTSDTHYGHRNILTYCKRPFASVEEMNEKMIENWNKVVRPNDEVYHLGDFGFFFMKTALAKPLINAVTERLNGTKHLILGNHDDAEAFSGLWSSIQHYKEIKYNKTKIVLCHFCFSVYHGSHKGAINLFGHSHGSHPQNNQQLDAGVDCWNYTPASLDQVFERLKTLPPRVHPDGHQPREDGKEGGF